MRSQIKLGKVFGIQIGLHYSWFLIALLIVFSLSSQFHSTNPQWGDGMILALAIGTAVLFFVSLLLHELAHSLVATSNQLPVREITLFALGGVSQICSAATAITAGPPVFATLHEPVIARLALWNLAPDASEVDVGQSSEVGYRITVTLPGGERVASGKPLWAQGAESLAWVKSAKIGPSQSYTRSLLLNEWFSFDAVGRYFVAVAIPGVEGTANVEVNVLPRDAARLRAVCERLSKDGADPTWGGDLDAARVLSFVSDDVAIPYLVRIASTASFTSGAGIEGLVRIGDLQAVSALASLPSGGAGLRMLLLSTNSEPVRQAIRGILGAAQK